MNTRRIIRSIALLAAFAVQSSFSSPAYAAGASPATSADLAAVQAKAFAIQQRLSIDAPDTKLDKFGTAIALDGDIAVVGAPGDDINALEDQGSAYVLIRHVHGGKWTVEAKLTAPDGAAFDRFGSAVAVRGNTIVVGAPLKGGQSGAAEGRAYVFTMQAPGIWAHTQTLVAPDTVADDYFGAALAMASERIVVSATRDDIGQSVDQGSVHTFKLNHSWTHEQKLTDFGGGNAGDNFGNSVAIDGTTLAVGADGDTETVAGQGSAYLYALTAGNWSLQSKVLAPDAKADDAFGASVSVSGPVAMVGAPLHDLTGKQGQDHGAAYSFLRTGSVWSLQEKIAASDASLSDRFGAAIALAGSRALITARTEGVEQGAAYSFSFGHGTWGETQKFAATDGEMKDFFGTAVAIDGTSALFGVPNDDVGTNDDEGSAYGYSLVSGSWTNEEKITASLGAAYDFFGYDAAIAGQYAVVGVPFAEVNGITNAGAAYVFVRNGSLWELQERLIADTQTADAVFGAAVDIWNDHIIVGAPQEMGGAAYLFSRTGNDWTKESRFSPSIPIGSPPPMFGYSVSVGDGIVAVGAPFSMVGAIAPGRIFIYAPTGASWMEKTSLVANDAADGAAFGASVAVSGESVVVGAPFSDVPSNPGAGTAYVFKLDRFFNPQQQARLQPQFVKAGARFGFSVEIYGDRAIVGAPHADTPFLAYDTGMATVFQRTGETWGPAESLGPVAPASGGDEFGVSVAIENDAAVIGSRNGGPADIGVAHIYLRQPGAPGSWTFSQTISAPNGAAMDVFGHDVALSGASALIGMPADDVDLKVDQGSAFVFIDANASYDDLPTADDKFVKTVAVAVNVTLTGADPEGASVTFARTTSPAHGTVTGTEPSLTYTPQAGFAGVDSFDYVSNDGAQDSLTATVTIEVSCAAGTTNNDQDEICDDIDDDDDNDEILDPVDPCKIDATNNCPAAAPVASNSAYQTQPGVAIATTLLATSPANKPLTYLVTTPPAAMGSVTGVAPNLVFTPAADFAGIVDISFKASDGTYKSNSAAVTITVAPDCPQGNMDNDAYCNDVDPDDDGDGILDGADPCPLIFANTCEAAKPVANDVAAQTLPGVAVNFALNATSPVNKPLSYQVSALNPAQGALTGQAPNLTFTPAPGFVGTVMFDYTVNDGTWTSDAATVTITVAPDCTNNGGNTDSDADCNDVDPDDDNDGILDDTDPCPLIFDNTCAAARPVASDVTVQTTPGVAVNFALNATSPANKVLTYQFPVLNPAQGTLTGQAPNLTFTPAGGFTGIVTFQYTAEDGTWASDAATVTITVSADCQNNGGNTDGDQDCNDLDPDDDNDGILDGDDPCPQLAANTCEAAKPVANDVTAQTLPGVAVNFALDAASPVNKPLSYQFTPPSPAQGTLTGLAPNLTFTPAAGFTGTVTFQYTAFDGTWSSMPATVTITVSTNCQNNGGNSDGDAQCNDIDPDDDNDGILDGDDPCPQLTANTCEAAKPVANDVTAQTLPGVAVNFALDAASPVNKPLSYQFTPPSPAQGTLTGLAPNLTFTPAAGFTGTVTFQYVAFDGTWSSVPATVTITVSTNCQNNGGNSDGDAQCNDIDPDDDNDGILDGNDPCPQLAANTCEAAKPVVNDVIVQTLPGVAVNFALDATSPVNKPLSYQFTPPSPAQGTLSGSAPNLSFTPAAGFIGTVTFQYTAFDGTWSSTPATVTITVSTNCQNNGGNSDGDAQCNDVDPDDDNDGILDGDDPCPQLAANTCEAAKPVANDVTVQTLPGVAVSFALDANSPANKALTYQFTPPSPAQGTLTGQAPNLTFTPAAGFVGTVSFQYTAFDGTWSSVPATVTITVSTNCQNNGGNSDGDAQCNDIDSDDDNDGILDGDDPCPQLAANTCEAAKPVANNVTAQTLPGVAVNFALDAASPVNKPLSYQFTPPSLAQGTLTGLAPNLTFTPAAGFTGTVTFQYVAFDGTWSSVPATVTITVSTNCQNNGGNSDGDAQCNDIDPDDDNDGILDGDDPCPQLAANTCEAAKPVANDVIVQTLPGVAVNFALDATSPANKVLTYQFTPPSPAQGALTGAAPNLTFTPAAGFTGTVTFQYTAFDGTWSSVAATVTIVVSTDGGNSCSDLPCEGRIFADGFED